MKKVIAIAAMDENRVIGAKDTLPWHIPEDLKFFQDSTRDSAILMGRRTYFSLPDGYRPLPKRRNIVVTRDVGSLDLPEEVLCTNDPLQLIESFRSGQGDWPDKTLWIGGGQEIYTQTMPQWDEIHLTLIPGEHTGDAFFPKFEDDFELYREESGEKCKWLFFRRPSS